MFLFENAAKKTEQNLLSEEQLLNTRGERHPVYTVVMPVWLNLTLLNMILFCDIFFSSRLYRVFGEALIQPILLATVGCIALFYAGIAFLKARLFAVFFFVATILIFVMQLQVFSSITSAPFSPNAAFQYIFLGTSIVYYILSKEGLRESVVKALLYYAIGYTILYASLASLYTAGALPSDIFAALSTRDIERGDRLFNYGGATAFAWFFFLRRLIERFSIKDLAMLLVCALAIVETLSRVYIAFVALISLLAIFRLRKFEFRLICLMPLYAMSMIYAYGFLDPKWNPFLFFSGDSSGTARSLEYEIARYFLSQHFFTGVGIAPKQDDIGALTGNFYFASGDLGMFGIWWDMGLLGVIMFFFASHVVCRPVSDISVKFSEPLFFTGAMMAGYGCIAAVIFAPTGPTYLCVIAGLLMDRAESRLRDTQAAQPRVAVA